MTPKCTAAWRNYECKINITSYERRTQDAFVAGWQAAIDAAVNAERKPRLCWICGQFLPHDCVGSAQPTADRLDGFTLLPDAQVTHGPPQKVEVFNQREKRALFVGLDLETTGTDPSTHIPGASILLYPEPANRLAPPITPAGRKWPIGTPDEHAYAQHTWAHRLQQARTHRGLTLDALARRLDPPRTRKDISAMEHGRRGLSVELCAQLADALDCDRLWLAGWTLEGAP